MYDQLAQLFGLQQAQQQGPTTLGAMPNPAMAQAPQAMQGQPPGQNPAVPPQAGGLDGFMKSLQTPGMLGLLGAGTSMLGAAGQPGGLGQALMAGAQGGLGGMMAGQQAQKEDERHAELMEIFKAQQGVKNRGGLAPMPRAAPGLSGAY